jgi:hypothetical protein
VVSYSFSLSGRRYGGPADSLVLRAMPFPVFITVDDSSPSDLTFSELQL